MYGGGLGIRESWIEMVFEWGIWIGYGFVEVIEMLWWWVFKGVKGFIRVVEKILKGIGWGIDVEGKEI